MNKAAKEKYDMHDIKRVTLIDRLKRAINAFRGKPLKSIEVGVEVKRCKTCEFKNREEVAYLCDQKQCEVCCYPECEHTFDINHAKNFDSDRFEINACAECNNMDRELIKDLVDQLEDAHETIESLDKRLRHLLQSEFVRQYDELDPKTHTYKRDIREADLIANAITERTMYIDKEQKQCEK